MYGRVVLKPSDQLRGAVDDIGLSKKRVPARELLKRVLKIKVGDGISASIVIQHSVEADGSLREQPRADRQIRLEGARGANSHDLERFMLGFGRTSVEIDVDQRVKLSHDNVNIVRANASRQHSNALAGERASSTDKFPVGVFGFDSVKKRLDDSHPPRISNKNDLVGQLPRLNVEVEYGAVGVNNEFRIGYWCALCQIMYFLVVHPNIRKFATFQKKTTAHIVVRSEYNTKLV